MQVILLVLLQWMLMAAVPVAWAGAVLWTVYLFRNKSRNVQRLLALLVFLTTVYVQVACAKWVLVLYLFVQIITLAAVYPSEQAPSAGMLGALRWLVWLLTLGLCVQTYWAVFLLVPNAPFVKTGYADSVLLAARAAAVLGTAVLLSNDVVQAVDAGVLLVLAGAGMALRGQLKPKQE